MGMETRSEPISTSLSNRWCYLLTALAQQAAHQRGPLSLSTFEGPRDLHSPRQILHPMTRLRLGYRF